MRGHLLTDGTRALTDGQAGPESKQLTAQSKHQHIYNEKYIFARKCLTVSKVSEELISLEM